MTSLNFRALEADEIDVRVSRIVEDKGVWLLLYKDARCDMRILDEVVGPENWQREHYEVKGRMFCRVGISIYGEWVWKSDCGVESNTESEKGESSDSFKRACFCWGVGRELYTAPDIWVPTGICEIKKGRNGNPVCYDRFAVTRIKVDDGKITDLAVSCNGKAAYDMQRRIGAKKPDQPRKDPVRDAKARLWAACRAYAEKHGSTPEKISDGVKMRSDYEETAEFFNLVAEEFEAEL